MQQFKMTHSAGTVATIRRAGSKEKRRRHFSSWKLLFCLTLFATLINAQEAPFEGHPSCPCLLGVEDGLPPVDPLDLTDKLTKLLGDIDISSYGIGCGRHDTKTAQCASDACVEQNVLPHRNNCDQSWCYRSFCFVDPLNCTLLNRRSVLFGKSGRYYSYATCYDMDSFSQKKLLSSLSGKTLRVGFNSNSGGWMGAYATDGKHFTGPIGKWTGPAVDLVSEAASKGNFQVALTPPPDFLANRSLEFFSPSKFDYCVYSTALGYLDMCVADYTVTEERAASTDWLLLGTEPLYLVVQTDAGEKSDFDKAMANVSTIFQPFTFGAWLFIICFVIPVLGCLMVFHEYNHSGSVFPSEDVVLVREDGGYEPERYQIPIYQHVIKSVYIALLSVLHQSYEASVVTYGAKLNLLGVAFFILTIIAVYTANLAAILTQQALSTSVSSLEDALIMGYRICGERKNIQDLGFIYGISGGVFAIDPLEEGGDGGPGFNCENCKSRVRVFDFLDYSKANEGDKRYCHAAIAPLQDLEKLQTSGKHCNKTKVGQPVRYVQYGMPVHEGISREVIALFLKLKNDGIYDKLLFGRRPESRCPESEGGEGSALNVAQLMGIWVVTFAFALLGLLVTWLRPYWLKKTKTKKGQIFKLRRHDQWGGAIHASPIAEDISPPASSPASHKLEPPSMKHIRSRDSSPPAARVTSPGCNSQPISSIEVSQWGGIHDASSNDKSV